MIDRNTLIYKFQRIKKYCCTFFHPFSCNFVVSIFRRNCQEFNRRLNKTKHKTFLKILWNASVMTTTSTITFSIGIRFPRLIVSYDLNLVIFICLCLEKSGCTNDKTKEYKMPSYYFYYYFLLLFLFMKTSYLLLYKVDFRRLYLSFCVSRLSRHKTLLLILSVRLGHMTRITPQLLLLLLSTDSLSLTLGIDQINYTIWPPAPRKKKTQYFYSFVLSFCDDIIKVNNTKWWQKEYSNW